MTKPYYEESILHRLISSATTNNIHSVKEGLKRDLEFLFNTRQYIGEIPLEMKEVHLSSLAYGLADFTCVSLKNKAEHLLIKTAIERAIRIFEPRLTNIIVSLYVPEKHDNKKHDNILKFQVYASIDIKPIPAPIAFDALVQPQTGKLTVSFP